MKNLISMTGFVLKQDNTINGNEIESAKKTLLAFHKSRLYANFLKQPLTLGMFVPCDLEGNVLENPYFEGLKHAHYGYPIRSNAYSNSYIEKYNEAKERVLFKGFEYKYNTGKNGEKYEYVKNKFPHVFSFRQIKNGTIESLLTGFKKEFEIELTESALKQIGDV